MNLVIFSLIMLLVGYTGTGIDMQGEQATEQVDKTFTLAPGAQVEISGLNGRLEIETWDNPTAEIHITVKASSRTVLEQRPLIVEGTPQSLVIRVGKDVEGGQTGWNRGWVRHQSRLKLPKNINLKVSGINGGVNAGAITGTIQLSGINGGVEAVQAGSAAEIKGINGGVTVSLLSISEAGLRVTGINGGVKLALPTSLNANIEIKGINGGINNDLPVTVVGEVKRDRLTGSIGSGGPPILISGINGGVTMRRN